MTETCLAMTIFRDEFDVRFIVLFALLLLVKIFHWIVQDRVDFVRRQNVVLSTLITRSFPLSNVLADGTGTQPFIRLAPSNAGYHRHPNLS